ncbi:hypothetical protein PWG71_21595 [Nocardiopsis sp. N85]|uniref:hypothetical protein n=1 Tax=Nocardiopsis sp. N85 TaxID=3029400 RepID=UPI00237FCC15|nr:hypothetical protein [Nocardiopsis sp. N85]MDE3723993.1 hypothetical protein [Nocardiopsis sp. N85]
MYTTARTSAKTLLVAAGAAGFIAFGSGIAGADTLGGVTDGLPLNDLGGQLPAVLTEGIGSPVGDLAKVQPGTISAAPDVQHNSAPVTGSPLGASTSELAPVFDAVEGSGVTDALPAGVPTVPQSGAVTPVTDSLTDALPADAPVALDGNSTDLGLDAVTGSLPVDVPTVPQSDPLGGAVGGLGLLDGLGGLGLGTGGLLPLSAPTVPQSDPLGGAVGGLGLLDGLGGLGLGTGGLLPLSAPTVPQSDPLGGAVGGLGLLDGLGGLGLLDAVGPNTGGTLPLSHPAQSPLSMEGTVGQLDGTVNELGAAVGQGTHEAGAGLTDLDAADLGAVVPMNGPVLPVTGQNTDISGGAADIVSDLVLGSDAVTLPQAAPVGGLPELYLTDDLPIAGTLPVDGVLPQAAPDDTLSELPAVVLGDDASVLVEDAGANDLLALASPTDLPATLPATDSVGGDLVGVNGLPALGEPTVADTPIGDLV